MIPTAEILTNEIEEVISPTKTCKINVDADRINGYTDDVDALIQAIYLILNTERYEYIIYSWDYGVELVDLYGKPIPYVIAVLERRITDALIQDNRISEVTNFNFEENGHIINVKFDVISDAGTIQVEKEVEV